MCFRNRTRVEYLVRSSSSSVFIVELKICSLVLWRLAAVIGKQIIIVIINFSYSRLLNEQQLPRRRSTPWPRHGRNGRHGRPNGYAAAVSRRNVDAATATAHDGFGGECAREKKVLLKLIPWILSGGRQRGPREDNR